MGEELEEGHVGEVRRRGCSILKDDFLPKESFGSWGNYVNSLSNTPGRILDRVVTRLDRVLIGLEARTDVGPAVVLSYVVSGISTMLAVFFYTEFVVEIPVVGRPPTGLSRSCLLFIIIAGLIHADKNNFTPFMPFGPCGVFKSSAVLFFAYTGFDVVSTMAEKTKNPGKDIPIGLVGSILLTTAVGLGWGKYMVAAGDLKGDVAFMPAGYQVDKNPHVYGRVQLMVGNPLRSSSPFCCLSDNITAGIQGARHAQFGVPLLDLHLSNNLPSRLLPPSFQRVAANSQLPNVINKYQNDKNDNISCLLTMATSSKTLEKNGTISLPENRENELK
ncbi:hypothetical protein MTR67_007465 [Solanum verrucosum]|uniref:Uncharacterized protein n=1 Tax=Solanum verrucosum TaxID=315347 RepID=A0AAF0TI82_SOLVR|nr:hypothetical protein MTR67_007465 [Solanum verrucosum]